MRLLRKSDISLGADELGHSKHNVCVDKTVGIHKAELSIWNFNELQVFSGSDFFLPYYGGPFFELFLPHSLKRFLSCFLNLDSLRLAFFGGRDVPGHDRKGCDDKQDCADIRSSRFDHRKSLVLFGLQIK